VWPSPLVEVGDHVVGAGLDSRFHHAVFAGGLGGRGFTMVESRLRGEPALG
jgi:hypothetical protein